MKEEAPRDDLRLDVNGLPVEEAVPRLIDHAAGLMASDLYFCTNENHVAVSVRHLGVVRLISVLPLDFGKRCMSHLKAVAGMDVAERRRPLDGRRIYQRPVSLLPSQMIRAARQQVDQVEAFQIHQAGEPIHPGQESLVLEEDRPLGQRHQEIGLGDLRIGKELVIQGRLLDAEGENLLHAKADQV